MSQALTFIWGQPPSAKSQGLLETLCCLLPQPQPLSWSRCTRTTPHLMGGWKGRRQGREENLQVNILNITQPLGDPQRFAHNAPFSTVLMWLLSPPYLHTLLLFYHLRISQFSCHLCSSGTPFQFLSCLLSPGCCSVFQYTDFQCTPPAIKIVFPNPKTEDP